MKAGGLQRTNSLFWFMACHMTAKVHRISKWRAAGSFCLSLRDFILVLLVILRQFNRNIVRRELISDARSQLLRPRLCIV